MPVLHSRSATSTSASTAGAAVLPAPAPSRLLSLDAARFVAALGVIWIHAAAFVKLGIADDSGFIGRFAVPFFTFTAVLYAAGAGIRQPQRTLRKYVLDRLLRLYVPFLAWTVLYLAFKQLQNIIARAHEPLSIGAWALWDGGSYHLWFLPFICATTIGAFALGKLQGRQNRLMPAVIALSFVGGALFALAPRPFAESKTLILRFGWDTIPAALWAMGLASLQIMKPGLQFRGRLWFFAGISLTISCLASLCIPGPHILLANLAGVGFSIVGFSDIRSRLFKHAQRLGTLAYGVYLIHIMPMGVLRSQAPRFLHLPITGIGFALLALLLVTIGSVVACLILSRYRITAWLVPGASRSAQRAVAAQSHTPDPTQPPIGTDNPKLAA